MSSTLIAYFFYAEYLKARPFNNRFGTWTELVSDFYSTPYHYQHTEKMLHQQKFIVGTASPSRH